MSPVITNATIKLSKMRDYVQLKTIIQGSFNSSGDSTGCDIDSIFRIIVIIIQLLMLIILLSNKNKKLTVMVIPCKDSDGRHLLGMHPY